MSKSNATEADLIAFIFNQTAIPWAGNAPVFRSITDAKDRITATTDADGDRLTVSLDGD